MPGAFDDVLAQLGRYPPGSTWAGRRPSSAPIDPADRRAEERGDVAICLTDLPLHAQRVPLVAQTSARRRAAVVSLPAPGLRQLRVPAVRRVVDDGDAGDLVPAVKDD